jgi:hypothetical protein
MKLVSIMSTALVLLMFGANAFALITPETARVAVTAFENNSNLQFGEVIYEQDETSPQWSSRNSYYNIQNAGYSSDPLSWMVDAATGEVFRAFYGDEYTDGSDTDQPFGTLSQEQCNQIAVSFVQSKYAGFNSTNFQASPGNWSGRGWEFGWREILGSGAKSPNAIDIEVNPINGHIQSYCSWRVAAFTSPQVQVTAEQALTIAVAACGITNLDTNDTPELFADPDSIYWEFTLQGSDDDGDHLDFAVKINAVSGVAVEISSARTNGSLSQPTNVLSNKTPTSSRVWIRNVVKDLSSASIQWLGKNGATLKVAGHSYALKPGSQLVKWDGGWISLSERIKLADGKLMVPIELSHILARHAERAQSNRSPVK